MAAMPAAAATSMLSGNGKNASLPTALPFSERPASFAFQIAMRDAFDGALRPDRHECGRFDLAVRRHEHAGARATFGVRDAERERHMLSLVE